MCQEDEQPSSPLIQLLDDWKVCSNCFANLAPYTNENQRTCCSNKNCNKETQEIPKDNMKPLEAELDKKTLNQNQGVFKKFYCKIKAVGGYFDRLFNKEGCPICRFLNVTDPEACEHLYCNECKRVFCWYGAVEGDCDNVKR